MTAHTLHLPLPIEHVAADRLLDFRPRADMWWQITGSAAETGGAYLETINHLGPARGGPPVHLHESAEETFAVLEGRLDVLIGDNWASLAAGESVTVPVGTPHTVDNRSGEALVFVNTHRPALRFEEMFREMHALVSARKLTLPPRGPRTAIYGAMLFTTFGDLQRVTKPPQVVFGALARAGRALGFRLESQG
jgi:mannose-6-phosphate isomerase-like protein (cupin superfamily)